MKSLPKILVATLAVSLFVVIASEWQRATSPLPEATWEAAAKYLIKHAKDDCRFAAQRRQHRRSRGAPSSRPARAARTPGTRGRIRRLWVVGRHRFWSKVSASCMPRRCPKRSSARALPDAFCARGQRAVATRPPAQRLGTSCRQRVVQPITGCYSFTELMHVSPTRLNRSGATHDLWAHPPSENRELTIRYDQIPAALGSSMA